MDSEVDIAINQHIDAEMAWRDERRLLEANIEAERTLIGNLRIDYANLSRRVEELLEEVDIAKTCQREAEQELVNFKRRVTERMHREADRRQWCSEYDDIMEEMGLERRSRDWEIEFVVGGRFTRTLRARNEETARRLALDEVSILPDTNYHIGDEYVYIDDISIESCVEAE